MLKQVEKYGIKYELICNIKNIFSNYPIKKAFIFGSRAKGTYRKNSDIDIAILADDNINSTTLNMIRNELEKLNTVLCFDVIDFSNTSKPTLQENILKEGILIYDRSE